MESRILDVDLEKRKKIFSSFTEINSLAGYKIRTFYDRSCYSLFNTSGKLLLSSGQSKNDYP